MAAMDCSSRLPGGFSNILRSQLQSVSKGGFSVFARKIRTISLTLAMMPLVLIARAVRPLVLVRFGPLRSTRIGDLTYYTEVYLCERDAGMHGSQTFDIFYHAPKVCNQQLKKMWDRVLHVTPWAQWLEKANRSLPGGEKHLIPQRKLQGRDIHGVMARSIPHISFTSEEESRGRAAMLEMGIPEGTPHVCFLARDNAYLNSTAPDRDWSHHDYRDATINNFLPAAEELTKRGYFAIRMGSVVTQPLETANAMIIDYPAKHRTEFMDIYLPANCRFTFGSDAGMITVPGIFRRPVTWVNMVPMEGMATWAKGDLTIPKKLWLRDEKRFMTFPEILGTEVGRFFRSEQYAELRIEVIEDTPQEIADVVLEMEERLAGRWETNKDDEELQARFWSLFRRSELNGVFLSRIGAQFLRDNRDLLR